MTKSKQIEREQKIANVVTSWAFDEGETYLMSFWELASDLNNSWAAPLFVSERLKKPEETYGEHWAVANYDLHHFRRQVNWTVRRMKGAEIIKQGYNEFYRFDKKVIESLEKESDRTK